ncbi:hypothetical protein CEXT_396521 [Caerostris extrusa]|uniref:Uncharacterized protein n=1 Tax=Caerostris extrusa TaxID=172846 RepID=A0AAV4S9J1_CAEEX|nr:hypothetical protein CEXT_396521 [Caerostris extrusa]
MSKSSQPGRVSIIPFPSLCTSRYRLLQQQLFPKSHRNSLQEREHQFILLLDILFPTPEFKVTQEPTLSHASLSASRPGGYATLGVIHDFGATFQLPYSHSFQLVVHRLISNTMPQMVS